IAVNSPPASGTHTTNSSAVEVIISNSATPKLASLFLSTTPQLKARAVALSNNSVCVLALDQASDTDIFAAGNNTTVNVNLCSVYSNSPSTQSVQLNGGATINAYAAYIVGTLVTSGGASLNATSGTSTGVSPLADPY